MDLYPWRFDSIHSHCHDDVIIFLKEFLIIWAIAHLRDTFIKSRFEQDLAYCLSLSYDDIFPFGVLLLNFLFFLNDFLIIVPVVNGKVSSGIDCHFCTKLVHTGLDRSLLWTDLVFNLFCS
jgi:hypothetical protein